MFISIRHRPLQGIARAACLFALVFSILALPGCDSDDPPEERETLRLVIFTGDETDAGAVVASLERATGEKAEVSRLFPDVDPEDDPDALAQMFLAIIPQGKAVSESSWDRAYELRDATGYARVEPDAEYTLEAASAAKRSSCFLDESGAPTDKGWSLDNMKVRDAWALAPVLGGRAQGEDIRVCHPDTGWTTHQELNSSRLDLASARNFLSSGPSDGRDPLDYSGGLLNPGHGTGTGAVIVSETTSGQIDGVAPKATLVPIRTAKSVIRVFDSDLAKSVHHAIASNCDVISMSLGGRAFFGLSAAIRNAKRNNLIVMAAAGNCVRFVVAPAAYKNCIAVGATGNENKPWRGSSRGRKVDFAAPGEHVWTAHIKEQGDPLDMVKAKQGTSFAVANTAGVAALWLAHHNLDRDTVSLPQGTYLQDVFLGQVTASVTVPNDWASHNGKYGAGIVNAKSLLQRPIPDSATLRQQRRVPLDEQPVAGLLADILDWDVDELSERLQEAFDADEEALPELLDEYGSELMQLAMQDPDEFERMLSGGRDDPTARTARRSISDNASTRLQSQLQ